MKRTLALLVSLFSLCVFPLAAQVDAGKQLARAIALIQQGRPEIAIAVLSSVSESPDLADADRGRAWALLGYAYREQRQFIAADNAFGHAFRLLSARSDHPKEYAAALDYYAGLLMEKGDLSGAAKALEQAAGVFRRTESHAELSQTYTRMAGLEIRRKKYKRAQAFLAGARAESLVSGEAVRSPDIDATSGWLAGLTGKTHEAVTDYQTALAECRLKYGDKHMITGWSYLVLGTAQSADHDFTAAIGSMSAGLEVLKDTVGTANVRYVAGELAYSDMLERVGSHEEAVRVSSAANASLKGLQSSACANCSVSVWELQHQ